MLRPEMHTGGSHLLRPEMDAGGSHLLRPPPTDAMVAQERDPPAAAAGGNRPPFTHFTEMRPWRDFRYKITKWLNPQMQSQIEKS